MMIIRKIFLVSLIILFLALAAQAQSTFLFRNFNPAIACTDAGGIIVFQIHPAFTQGSYICVGNSYVAFNFGSGSVNLLPDADNTLDLGSSTFRWRALYTTTLDFAGNQITYSNAIGPRFYDQNVDAALVFNIQSFSTNRTITFPNASGTLPLLESAQTWTGAQTFNGGILSLNYKTTSNCIDNAGPAACGSAAAGSVVINAGATSVVVSTTAVTADSQIFVEFDSSLGTRLGVTCNTTFNSQPGINARTAGVSFTFFIGIAPVTNPACYSYMVIN